MSAGTAVNKPLADIQSEAMRILGMAEQESIVTRLIGGVAIPLLAGPDLHPAFAREIRDLDFVVSRSQSRNLDRALEAAGYEPNVEFNSLNRRHRMLFHDSATGRQVDVFVGRFEMCHTLPLVDRLEVQETTLPAADVLMTKLQIVHLNRKDRADLLALLHSFELGDHDAGAINVAWITSLTSQDWGMQHTFELNLERLAEGLRELDLPQSEIEMLRERIAGLEDAMQRAPKSRKWGLRARIGERKQWYEEPEEVDRG